MNIVTKVALTNVVSKKSRSGVICTAIFLMMVLFMTIVSITSNTVSGYSLMVRLASGTDYHGYLRTSAFSVSGEELRDKALSSEDIAQAVISTNVASYALNEADTAMSRDVIRAVEAEIDLRHFFTEVVEGSFPRSDSEILVNPLHFPDAMVGDKIGLYYTKLGEEFGHSGYAEFTVSGLIQGRADTQLKVVMRYSDTLLEAYDFTNISLNVYFMFKSSMNLTGKYDRLVNETLAEYKCDGLDVYGILSPAYLTSAVRELLNPSTVFLVLFSVAVVFFCSFLLIYNIYSIALTQDMQSFGMLSVIGMTHKQLRRMICVEALMLLALTLLPGLIAGYFVGWKTLSPLMLSPLSYEGFDFEFNLWIPILTILLTSLTLLWSATRPLKKLRSMTPIATVDYTPSTDLPGRYVRKKNHSKKNVTPNASRLAAYSVSRNRKRTVITALSMSMSVVLFMLISTLCDYMITYTESNLQFADYILTVNPIFRHGGMSDGYTTTLRADAGVGMSNAVVRSVEKSVYTDRVWRIRTAMTTLRTPEKAISELRKLQTIYKWFDGYPELSKAMNGELDVFVVSIPDELFSGVLITEKEPLGVAEGVAVLETSKGIRDSEDNEYAFSYLEDGDTITLGESNYEIRLSEAIIPTQGITGYILTSLYRATVYMPESEFISTFGEGLIYSLLIKAKEDCYEQLRGELEPFVESMPVELDDRIHEAYLTEKNAEVISYSAELEGRYDEFEQIQSIVYSLKTVGYSLSSMIFLVGILNIVNTSLSSVSERRRELAMLESIGMTDRQLMRMLLGENLYGVALAAAATLFIGYPLIRLIVSISMDALVTPDLTSGGLMLVICTVVSLVCSAVVFRFIKSDAVAERIKVD